ncbi:unnamed protein product [Closterium sp. Naga37s-1]|nr:unnamed protein product [Closterium sp. Naga37s-1]
MAGTAGNAGNVGHAAANVSLVLSESASSEILACSFLMATTMLVAYISKKHHWVYFPESSAALVLGMVFGVLSLVLEDDLAFTFSPEIFFYGLLPIIIFNAGYALKKKDFFRNFWTITLFAVVGTIISTLVYGLATYSLVRAGIVTHMTSDSPLLESLIFGSLISAIDPVATLSILQDVQAPTLLYNLVFGESLVNDAVSIVLFRTFASFTNQEFSMASIATAIVQFLGISVGSILLGILVSLLCALILRFIDINSEFSKFELSLVLVSGYLSYSVAEMLSLSGIMALFFCGICNAHYGAEAAKFELSLVLVSGYLSYSVAEMLSLSGIMALFFCGICNAHYGYYNISHASKISSKYAFEALSFMAEMFVFAYLGMQVVVMQHVIDWGLLLSAIPLCLLSRAFNVFPLSFLSNCTQANKIPTNMILMMWLSGLRGAIAFALALNMPQRNPAIISTTLFVVVLTTVVMGGSTCPLLRALGLSAAHPHTPKHARASLAGNWVEQLPSAFEDHVLVKFSDPDVTIDGDPVAELDVICFSVRPSGISSLTEFGDPMNFLLTEWDDICPELAAGVSASSKVGSSGGDTSKAGGAGTSKPLAQEENGSPHLPVRKTPL